MDRNDIRIQTVETTSSSMDYLRFGNGEKSFVILPGLSVQSVLASATAIVSAFKRFTEDYTVYLFDRRKDLPAKYVIHDMAQDTAGAMRALGLKDAYVYGASQGGMIAMDLALNNPDLVQKMVLASTAARVTEESFRVIEKWITLAKAGKAEDLYMAFGEDIYPSDMFRRVKGALSRFSRSVTAEELDRFVILAEGLKGFDIVDELGKIHCPVLVVASRDDKVIREKIPLQIADALPEARLHMYDGYGHAVYDTAPDFTERMLAFFGKGSEKRRSEEDTN